MAFAHGQKGEPMKVMCKINDYSDPAKPSILIHSSWPHGERVELEVDDERYTVDGEELISAIKRCMLNVFEK